MHFVNIIFNTFCAFGDFYDSVLLSPHKGCRY